MKREDYRKMKIDDSSHTQPNQNSEGEKEESLKDIVKGMFKNRWIQGLLCVAVLLIAGIVIMLSILSKRADEEEMTRDYTKVIPGVSYTLTIEEQGDRLTGWIESEELEPKDAVTLSSVIRSDNDREVTLYVFEQTLPDQKVILFHEEGLRYDVKTYPDNRYETRSYHHVPAVEANVENVKDWDISAQESYMDNQNVLHVKTSVPTLSTTEETLSFLKGLSSVITDMNEDQAFADIQFDVSLGISTIQYSANHPTIIAETNLFQMEQVTKGD